jgi:hypothetical protein
MQAQRHPLSAERETYMSASYRNCGTRKVQGGTLSCEPSTDLHPFDLTCCTTSSDNCCWPPSPSAGPLVPLLPALLLLLPRCTKRSTQQLPSYEAVAMSCSPSWCIVQAPSCC